MALQLVYTSIRSGLVAGRSGFCTAARHKELKESIVSRIEDFSNQYDRSLYDGQNGDSLPVIYQHRIISIRETSYHVLMRLGDAGNDYSGRTNHIAHAFILEASEVAGLRVSPAEAILAITKAGLWLKKYEESAKYFGPEDTISFQNFPTTAALPAQNWKNETGAAGNAALLFDDGAPQSALFAATAQPDISPERLLKLFSESLLLNSRDRSNPSALWSVPFTTLLQSGSERRQFTWFGCLHDSDLFNKTKQTSPVTIGLERNISPPASALADYAEGREPQSTTSQIESGPEISATKPSALIGAQTTPAHSETTAQPSLQPLGHSIPESPISSTPPRTRDPNSAYKRKRKPQRSGLTLTVSLLTLVALCAGGIAFWFNSTKEERAAEQIINALVEDGNWKAVLDEFEPRGSINPKLSDDLKETYDFAFAFYRIEKISENPEPDQVRAIIPGLENAGAAFNKIKKEVPRESEFASLLAGRIEEAEKKIASWNALKNESSKLTKKISREVKWTEFTGEQLDGLIKEIENHCRELRDYETQVNTIHARNASKFNETKLYLSHYRRLKFPVQDRTLEDIENAREEISKLVNQIGRSKLAGEGEFIKLNASFSILGNKLDSDLKEKKTELAKASETPNKNDEPTKVNLVEATSTLKTVIVPVSKLSDPINLGFAEGGLPPIIPIRPFASHDKTPSNEKRSLTKIGEDKYYIDSNPLFKALDSNTLQAEDSSFLSDFGRGFILEFTEAQTQYVIIGHDNNKLPIYSSFNSQIVTRKQDGSLSLSEEALELLSSIEIAGEQANFELRIVDPPLAILPEKSPDPRALNPDWINQLGKEITKQTEQRNKIEEFAQLNKKFSNLGETLFPEYFNQEGVQYLKIQEDQGKFKIEKVTSKDTAGLPTIEGRCPHPINFPTWCKYVEDLADSLDELATGDPVYNKYAAKFEKYIGIPAKECSPELPSTLEQFSKESQRINPKTKEEESWLDEIVIPKKAVTFENKVKAEDALKKYRNAVYFRDFLKGWNEVFTEENRKSLESYFQLAQDFNKTRVNPDLYLKTIDDQLKKNKSAKDKIENKLSEQKFELLISVPDPSGPANSREYLLLRN